MKAINYELEIIFIHGIMEKCQDIRHRHDAAREKFSTAINELFNTSWAQTSEPIKRGAMIGALKSGETVLNETQAHIFKLEELLSSRASELDACHRATVKTKKGKR